MRKLSLVLAAAILAACSGHEGIDHSSDKGAAHISEGTVISAARVLPPFPGRDTAAGYFEITNHGKTTDTLLSATSPISPDVEIHNHIEEDGVMKMRRVNGVDIAPGETVIFRPGSYHLMLFKTKLAEDQQDVSLTLNYKNAEPVTLIVDIEGRGKDSKDKEGENYGSSHDGH